MRGLGVALGLWWGYTLFTTQIQLCSRLYSFHPVTSSRGWPVTIPKKATYNRKVNGQKPQHSLVKSQWLNHNWYSSYPSFITHFRVPFHSNSTYSVQVVCQWDPSLVCCCSLTTGSLSVLPNRMLVSMFPYDVLTNKGKVKLHKYMWKLYFFVSAMSKCLLSQIVVFEYFLHYSTHQVTVKTETLWSLISSLNIFFITF